MNKKLLLEEINKFRKLTNLPLLKEAYGGEGSIFRELWNTVFKNEVKAIEKGVFDVVTKEGKTIKLKPAYAKDLLSKDIKVLTAEEKEAFVALHDNLVKDFGVQVIAKELDSSLKMVADTLERKATKRYLLDNYFGKTKVELERELNNISHPIDNSNVTTTVNDIAIPAVTEIPFVPTNIAKELQTELVSALEPLQHNPQAQIDFISNINPQYFDNYQKLIELETAKTDLKTKQTVQPHVEKTQIKKEEIKQQIYDNKQKISDLEVEQKQAEVDAQNIKNKGSKIDNKTRQNQLNSSRIAVAKGCGTTIFQIGMYIMVGSALWWMFTSIKSCGTSVKEIGAGKTTPGTFNTSGRSTNSSSGSGSSSGNKSHKGILDDPNKEDDN